MTHYDFVEEVCRCGIEAARDDYADKPSHLEGALAGFDECRGKTVEQLLRLYEHANHDTQEAMILSRESEEPIDTYWRLRCRALEIEWVLNCLSAALRQPFLGHLPTVRGAMQAARILGVQETPDAPPA